MRRWPPREVPFRWADAATTLIRFALVGLILASAVAHPFGSRP